MNKIIVAMGLLFSPLFIHTVDPQQPLHIDFLEKYIISADVTGFIEAYRVMNCTEETRCHLIEKVAHHKKEFASELEHLKNSGIISKRSIMLILQILGFLYCTDNAINLLYMALKNTTLPYAYDLLYDIALNKEGRLISIPYFIARYPGATLCVLLWQFGSSTLGDLGKTLSEAAYRPLALAPCALFCFLGYKAFHAARKNMTQERLLTNQIKNLDEIIEFLRSQNNSDVPNPEIVL